MTPDEFANDTVFNALVAYVVCVTMVAALVMALLAGLTDSLSNHRDRPSTGEGLFGLSFHPLRKLGAIIMTAVDTAIARLSAWATDVLDKLKGVKDVNDAQTAKIAELQSALDAATANDAADAATIAALQAEVSSLQDEVAAKINALVDELEATVNPAPPVVPDAPAEPPVVDEPVVADTPAADQPTDTPAE